MSKYNKKITKRIFNLVKSGKYNISEICELVGITKATYYTWLEKKTDFLELVDQAKGEMTQIFVKEAKKSLLKKIQGYEVEYIKTVYVDSGETYENGKLKPKIKEFIKTTKHIPPDTTAIIFMLTNGDPENFRNKFIKEFTGIFGVVEISGAKDISKLQEL